MTPRLRWSLVTPLLVVVGLFGMHGLGEHGAGHDPMSSTTSSVAAVATAATDAPSQVLEPLSGHGMDGMAMGLCVAILLGGLLAAYVASVATRRAPWVLPRLTAARVPLPRSRAPDPPTPALLSVCRC